MTMSGWILLMESKRSIVSEIMLSPKRPFSIDLSHGRDRIKLAATKEGGIWNIRLEGTKDGKNLAGSDERFTKERYLHQLNGAYSIPAKEPDGRLKVVQDRVSKAIRLYWGFQLKVAGETKSGWMEFPPIPVKTLPALNLKTEGTIVKPLKIRSLPLSDKDDRKTGFRAVKRSYNWSGTDGTAWVITFGKECKWRNQDVKLVFPEGSSWVPGYQLSSKLMYQFEFLETWDGGAKGCFEPMSDRVNRFSKVELLEDKKDRKVLKWTYQLINPDYLRWGESLGSKQDPIAEEIWTVFPDGTAKRVQRYWAPLDTSKEQHVYGTQIAEIDVVWASNTLPEEVTPNHAITVFSPQKTLPISYPSQRQEKDPKFGSEPIFGIAAHSKDSKLPDVFAIFDHKGTLNPPYQISVDDDKDWHRDKFFRFSHFPFNLEPFMYETNSQTSGRGQLSHSSLVYVGAPADRNWETSFKMDRTGRKYREWTTTVGLSKKGDFKAMLNRHRKIVASTPSSR